MTKARVSFPRLTPMVDTNTDGSPRILMDSRNESSQARDNAGHPVLIFCKQGVNWRGLWVPGQ